MNEEEMHLQELLNTLDKRKVKYIITNYIKDNRLHSEYISLIIELSKDYIDDANWFIERFKRDVNVLYRDDVYQNVAINKNNWYWYARLLRESEDEVYPKNNYLQPTYLLKRLKPIIAELDIEELKKDDELYELYQICLNLYDKYGISGGEN